MRLNFRRKRYLSHLLRDVKSSIEALRFEIKPDLHDFLLRRYSLNDRRFFIGAVMLLAVYQPALCNTINKYFALTRYFSRNSQSPISLQKTIPGFNVTVKKKKRFKMSFVSLRRSSTKFAYKQRCMQRVRGVYAQYRILSSRHVLSIPT